MVADEQLLARVAALESIVAELQANNLALKATVAALEARRPFTYRAVWNAYEVYQSNDTTTYDGSMWIAVRDSPRRPGDADSGWQLCVKRGRDGRSGRAARKAIDDLQKRVRALESEALAMRASP